MKTKPMLIASIGLLASLAQGASLAGLWTFDNAANPGEASFGADLSFIGTAPTYSASVSDDGGNSQTGVILSVAGSGNQISSAHGIPVNGGGAFVNQYSIVADIFSPAGSRDSWRTIYQTNLANTNDGEFFIRNSDDFLGVAAAGYSSAAIDETSWIRLVLTVDLAKTGDDILSYVDGAPFFSHPSDLDIDSRFSLDPSVLFFSDNDGDDAPMNVGMLAIYEGVLTPGEVASLGVAGAAIVPEPSSSVLVALCGLAGLLRRKRRV